MGLANLFTWWNGATAGTRLFTRRNGARMGEDTLGNLYFQGGRDVHGRPRRWVIFKGANDSSRVPPEWYSWLLHMIDAVPDEALPPVRAWQQPPIANLTGTNEAYLPRGALEAGGRRAAATCDYEAWSPDAA